MNLINKKTLAVVAGICILFFNSIASENDATSILHIKQASSEIILDGNLNEPAWQEAEAAGNFKQHFPYDTSFAISKTEVRITFNQKNLYIAAVCFDESQKEYVVQSLKRDFDQKWNDCFAINIDPFGDGNNAFHFGVSPMGAQREALITGGGVWGGNDSWDSKWYSVVVNQDDKWIVEIAIPFKTLRFNSSSSIWEINFFRNDLKRQENSHWSPVPKNYSENFLGYNGELIWDNPPPKSGTNISLIPYVIGQVSKDFEKNEETVIKPNLGMDAKIAVTSSLNLDLTINPDFSQVDVDKQVSNLTRFSLHVPEKRNFFLENSDLFDDFGFRMIRPFFSRNIGLYTMSDFEYKPVPILAGTRLSGKLNNNLLIGLLNAQTGRVPDLNIESQNYNVFALRQQTGGKSYLSFIFVNRQAFPADSIALTKGEKKYFLDKNDYNRVLGGDYFYASKNNKFAAKTFYHHSFSPDINGKSYAHASFFLYNSTRLFAMWNHEYVGSGYNAEVGFVPRILHYNPITDSFIKHSYWRFEPYISYRFYSKSGIINHQVFGLYMNYYLDDYWEYLDRQNELKYELKFQNASNMEISLFNDYTRLIYPSDINGTFDSLLPADGYSYNYAKVEYGSSKKNKINGGIESSYGGFYNGTKLSASGSINYRLQPWGNFSLSYSRDKIAMPAPYMDAVVNVIGTQIELSFSKSVFFSTFVQYNDQIKNVNINSRFQWRFKPMSDLFFVYTDNHYTFSGFPVRNRAFVLKLVYWFNP